MGDEPNIDAFGLALKRARGDMSQRQFGDLLASHIGYPIPQTTVSEWENGRPPDPHIVFAIEDAVGCEPGELSHHLGYVPVGDTSDVLRAIEADDGLSDDAKNALVDTYRAFVRAARQRRNRR